MTTSPAVAASQFTPGGPLDLVERAIGFRPPDDGLPRAVTSQLPPLPPMPDVTPGLALGLAVVIVLLGAAAVVFAIKSDLYRRSNERWRREFLESLQAEAIR